MKETKKLWGYNIRKQKAIERNYKDKWRIWNENIKENLGEKRNKKKISSEIKKNIENIKEPKKTGEKGMHEERRKGIRIKKERSI